MAPKIKLLANADKTGNPEGLTNRRFPTRIFSLSHTIKIGVIDDDDLVRGAIESLIQSLGYEVDTFTSAAEYLSSKRAHDHSCNSRSSPCSNYLAKALKTKSVGA